MKNNIWKTFKNRFNHIIFSNKFHKVFIRPFDKFLFETIPTEKLIKERELSIPLNKICQVADIFNPDWAETAQELKHEMEKNNFHRKDWEYTQIIYSLKKLNFLTPKSVCLAVGAGREHLLYYLTHKIANVYGIDLYEGFYYGGEDESDIPRSTERYAPFPYDPEKLKLFKMDALNLKFNENEFDFIFSASSIEHFGGKKEILISLQEMFRVLKPGGIAVITTELKLTKLGTKIPNVRPFFLKEVKSLVRNAGFILDDKFDTRIEEEYYKNWVKLPEEIYKRPHVYLRFFNTVFTSVHAVLKKPGSKAFTGRENNIKIPEFEHKGDIFVKPKSNTKTAGQILDLKISLKNKGNYKWINTGVSHRIALGLQLWTEQEILFDRDFITIILPNEIPAGGTLNFETSIKTPEKKGRWIFRFDLKKELVFWFSEKGSSPFDLKMTII